MSAWTHEELVEQLQSGRIDHLQFLMNGEHNSEYLQWCREHGIDPDPINAEFYCDWTDADMMDKQFIDDESYGIWN